MVRHGINVDGDEDKADALWNEAFDWNAFFEHLLSKYGKLYEHTQTNLKIKIFI